MRIKLRFLTVLLVFILEYRIGFAQQPAKDLPQKQGPLPEQKETAWTEVISKGNFALFMPVPVQEKEQNGNKIYFAKAPNGAIYQMRVSAMAADSWKGREETLLDDHFNRCCVEFGQPKVVRDDELDFFGKYPGREYLLESGKIPVGEQVLVREMVMPDRVYHFSISGPKDYLATSRDCQQFLLSFFVGAKRTPPPTASLLRFWKGTWQNSLWEKGDESFEVSRLSENTFSGWWTDTTMWGKPLAGDVAFMGDRIGLDTYYFEGKTQNRWYQLVARMDGNELIVNYCATRLNSPGRYYGWETMTDSGQTPEIRARWKERNALWKQARELVGAGSLPKAVAVMDKIIAIEKEVLGKEDQEIAASWDFLARIHQQREDYPAARRAHKERLAIQSRADGPASWRVKDVQLDLIYLDKLELLDETARRELLEASQLLAKAIGCNRPGQYQQGADFAERALAIRLRVLGEEAVETGLSANWAGYLWGQAKQLPKADAKNQQALTIYRKAVGELHPYTAAALQNLGLICEKKEDLGAARNYYDESLAIRIKVQGDSHLTTRRTLAILGQMLFNQGDYGGARLYYEQLLASRKKALGDYHVETADALVSLSITLNRLKEYSAARPYAEQALMLHKKVSGRNHPSTARALNNLGVILVRLADYSAARPCFEKTLAITRRHLDLSAAGQTEQEQLRMRKTFDYQFNNLLSLPLKEIETESTYAQVLIWKGAIFARQQRLRLERSADPLCVPLVVELRATSSKFAKFAFATPPAGQREGWFQQLQSLSERKEKLERELAQKSQSFRQDEHNKNLTPARFLELLPTDTVLVDYVVYRQSELDPSKKEGWSSTDHLTAFVLRPGKAIVRLDLGPMAPIHKALDLWRARTRDRSIAGEDHPGLELHRCLWKPLEKHLTGAKTVLISPDGALGRFPFAALPGSKEGSYLLEDVALSVVPVPRLLPETLSRENKQEQAAKPSLLLVGDVDFDAGAGQAAEDAPLAGVGERSGNNKWKRLPATLGEILVIERHFKKRFKGAHTETLSEDQATEANLREAASQYSYLHLATHGFFAPSSVRSALANDAKERSAGEMFGQQELAGFHPGLLSGLVLAGANKPPAPGQSDGILSALEVADLDLRKVELAVLSACETGLGEVAAGEGVLGLQRAFQVAGAKSVVASLWNVNDDATRKLMERFYENLWQKKMSKQEALRQAQLAMLRGDLGRGFVPDEQKQNPRLPPHFWAAFVLSGDWR